MYRKLPEIILNSHAAWLQSRDLDRNLSHFALKHDYCRDGEVECSYDFDRIAKMEKRT
jgi:hypothetical protein